MCGGQEEAGVEPFVVVVHGNRQDLLSQLLAYHKHIQVFVHLWRGTRKVTASTTHTHFLKYLQAALYSAGCTGSEGIQEEVKFGTFLSEILLKQRLFLS